MANSEVYGMTISTTDLFNAVTSTALIPMPQPAPLRDSFEWTPFDESYPPEGEAVAVVHLDRLGKMTAMVWTIDLDEGEWTHWTSLPSLPAATDLPESL